MLDTVLVTCPHCGERFETTVDASAGDAEYIEDCHVCCRPINVAVSVDEDGAIAVQAWAENEA